MSEKKGSVASHVSIQFTWRDEDGRIPSEQAIEALHEEALQQAAQGILSGAREGALEGALTDGGNVTQYQGEWTLQLDWRLRSRKAQ